MKRWIIPIGAMAAIGIALHFAAGAILVAYVNRTCADCRLEAGGIRLMLFPLALHGEEIYFHHGQKKNTAVDWRIKKLVVPVVFLPLLRGRIQLGKVRVIEPDVRLTEGDAKAPDSRDGGLPGFAVEGISIVDGSFLYERIYSGQNGTIRVSGIKASVGSFGNFHGLENELARAEVEARLEESGDLKLWISAILFRSPFDVNVRIKIGNQPLAQVNDYFLPSSGISLKGHLVSADATTEVSANELVSNVNLVYRGLQVEVNKTKERSAAAAFFTNLLSGALLDDSTVDDGSRGRTGRSRLKRNPGESIVTFLFRGMKEATMSVVKD